jgi:predicted MPP superfamily phosphohydrolase
MLTLTQLILRFGLTFLLVIAVDWYVFQAFRVLFKKKRWINFAYWGANISYLVITLVIFLTAGRAQGPNSHLLRMVFGGFIMLFVPKLVIAFFLLLEDAFRAISALKKITQRKRLSPKEAKSLATEKDIIEEGEPSVAPNPLEDTLWMPRREFISKIGIFTASLPFIGIAHGITFGAYNYQIHRHTIRSRYLPDAFNGFRLIQISDIHAGSLNDTEAVARGIDLILAQQADLIVFTGDLVNNYTREVNNIFHLLARLQSPEGVISILGNHDYGHYARWPSEAALANEQKEMAAAHRALGWRLLKNENFQLKRGADSIAILGVENWGKPPFPQYGDLEKTLEGIEEQSFKILLSHDPTHWDAQALHHPKRIDLTLSGHTHGMQFGVEVGGFKWSPVSLKYPRWAGLYQEGEKFLNVNRGFGFIGFPGRVGIFPEITVITLEKA